MTNIKVANGIKALSRKELEECFVKSLHNEHEAIHRANKLEQENNQLKLDFELYKDNHIYKNYEVERKDIVIKELRSWLEEYYDYSDCIKIKSVLKKLNELEGKNDNE